MEDGQAADVLCNEEAVQPEQPEESILPEPTEQPAEQPTEQPTEPPKPKAKAKPKGRPPPKEGEATPLRPRLTEKTTCPECDKQISSHALHYNHSKVCKRKTKSNIVWENIQTTPEVEQPKPKAKTVKPITASVEENPLKVVQELPTYDLSENEV